MKHKLLSICIPTYNRAEVLDDTLNKLFSNPDFNENLIEVIVSDNCSTDNTAEIVSKYPLASYYCNKENIRDFNFSVVLEYATGSYIRLFNDTLSFKTGKLKLMLERIEKYVQEDCNFFYYNNNFLNSNCKNIISKKEDFLKTVSYYSTWIANFGCWRKDFEKINNKDRYANLQFVQVDWSYRIIENKTKTIIYFDDFFEVASPNKKGGYNIVKAFVNNYLMIINNEKFSLFNYEREKYFLCRYFIFPWLTEILIVGKSKYSFEMNDSFKIMFKKYWYEPYFYVLLCAFRARKLLFKGRKL